MVGKILAGIPGKAGKMLWLACEAFQSFSKLNNIKIHLNKRLNPYKTLNCKHYYTMIISSHWFKSMWRIHFFHMLSFFQHPSTICGPVPCSWALYQRCWTLQIELSIFSCSCMEKHLPNGAAELVNHSFILLGLADNPYPISVWQLGMTCVVRTKELLPWW